MPNIQVVDMAGKKTGDITLNDTVFGITPNAAVMHMAVVTYLANQRQGTQSTLTRSEVRGGGKKPWRQKGTGRARHGSTRSPIWTHGGVALGPKPRSYRKDMNKKVRQLAIKSALSDKVANENLIVLDAMTVPEFKTKLMVNTLNAIGAGKKALILLDSVDMKAVKSASNIPGVKTSQVNTINAYDIINADTLVIVKDAIAKVEEVYAS